jgi:hypothetical protein
VCILGNIVGASMPNGGGVLSAVTGLIGDQLQQHEYNRFQDRMALVTDVGTVEELADIARQVARQLADRYEEQLLCLKERQVPVVCCSCCICCKCCKKDDSSAKPRKSIHPAEKIAQFGVVCAVQGILDEELEQLEFNDDTKCEDLAKAIANLICRAKPNFKAKVLRQMNLDKDLILPHTPFPHPKEGEKLSEWHIHDFYQKPGIRFEGESVGQNPLSWMNPNLYGYRLGTDEEYKNLFKFDKKQTETNCCGC